MQNTLLQGMNEAQQRATTAGLGAVQVLAGPGSGKTRVLTHRIAYLIQQLGVRPYNILAVTFTNKAAREMEARVERLIGETRGLMLGTFHATCAYLLRREADHLPIDRNFVIYDQDDQRGVVRQAIKDLDLNDKLYKPTSVHNKISMMKNELILPDEFPINSYGEEVTRRIYEVYQKQLIASNALDFDDLLLYAALLLEDNPAVREKYSRRFEHLLVDEFQDTNQAQYRLLTQLASHHGNLFVVGDADQSIYRWRGADYRNMQRFEEDYIEAEIIKLEQNYRSTQVILDAAMAVIEPNEYRVHKELFTSRKGGQKIGLHMAADGRYEGRFIVDKIATLTRRGSAQPGDFAIMYRTNAQSRLIEEAFLHANLPYKLVGAQRFYGRREIKDMLAYLRLVYNTNDEISLLRVINTPRRKIGNKTVATLRVLADRQSVRTGKLLLSLNDTNPPELPGISAGGLRALKAFASKLEHWQVVAAEVTPLELLDEIIADTDYQSYLDDGTDEGQERWENVMEMRRLAAEYSERTLSKFLEDLALVSDQDTVDESANVPTLLTLHAAKGLEFPYVFITGLEDGTLPHSRSFDDPEEMAEERRLLYVGITRAENQVILTMSQVRSMYGYTEVSEPSRFLADIPDELIQGGNPYTYGRPAYRDKQQYEWNPPSREKPKPKADKIYSPGMTISHKIWGEGVILTCEIDGGDEIVEIFFSDKEVGKKKVIASLAQLEIVREV